MLFSLSQNLKGCRLWAIYAKDNFTLSTLDETSKNLARITLENFFFQSNSMPSGWSLMGYNLTVDQNGFFVQRSSIPAVQDSSEYWTAANNILNNNHFKIGMGHLRMASSGAFNIPNPHPWTLLKNGTLFSLIHNGTLNKDLMHNLITNNGQNLSWLEEHNPQTFSSNLWNSNEGWQNVVDSELLLFYLVQQITLANSVYDGLKLALENLIIRGVPSNQLNIVLSIDEDIYLFGGKNKLSIIDNGSFTCIMTSPAYFEIDSNIEWYGIADREMVQIDTNGLIFHKDFVRTTNSNDVKISSAFTLNPAYPNPFNGIIKIPFESSLDTDAEILIFSILGEEIYRKKLSQSELQNGFIYWDPLNSYQKKLSSGTYIIKSKTAFRSSNQKILFIK